jgi:diguanylate cyclase (GGDEF)-like protein
MTPRWPCFVLVALLVFAGGAPLHASQQAAAGDAAAFDALYQRLTGVDSYAMTYESILQQTVQLKALLPGNDALRSLRYHTLYCNDDAWVENKPAMDYIEAQITLATQLDAPAEEARLRLCRAYYLDVAGLSQASVAEIDRAVPLARRSEDPYVLGDVLATRGDAYSIVGEQAKALVDYRVATAVLSEAGAEAALPSLLLGSAIIYRRMGDLPRAGKLMQRLQAQLDPSADWETAWAYHHQLGYLHLEAGRPGEAREAFTQAIDIASQGNHPRELEGSRLAWAEASVEDGSPRAALELLDQVEPTLAASDRTFDKGYAALVRGKSLAALGRHNEALALYAKAQAGLAADDNPRYLSELYLLKSVSHEALGSTARALSDYRRHIALKSSIDDRALVQQQRLTELEAAAQQQQLENRRLRGVSDEQQQQLDASQRVRRWQFGVLLLGGLLLASLLLLAVQQRRRSRKMRRIIDTDPLTGVASRLHIYRNAGQAIQHALLQNEPLAILMADIDHFKQVNDRCGHPAGDEVLKRVARVCRASLRQHDLIGRTGGEEFLVVCPDTHPHMAREIAERLRTAIEQESFADICTGLNITMSIGVAGSHNPDSLDAIIERADTALYRAKEAGRNRVDSYDGVADG